MSGMVAGLDNDERVPEQVPEVNAGVVFPR